MINTKCFFPGQEEGTSKMDFLDESKIKSCQSPYEVAALCYKIIKENLAQKNIREQVFLSSYVFKPLENNTGVIIIDNDNSSIGKYRCWHEKLHKIMQDFHATRKGVKLFIDSIIAFFDSLTPSPSSALECLASLYALLAVIDEWSYNDGCDFEVGNVFTLPDEEVATYRLPSTNAFDAVISKFKLRHRQNCYDTDIKSHLLSLLILEKSQLPSHVEFPPKISIVSTSASDGNDVFPFEAHQTQSLKNHLTVAIIHPLSKSMNADTPDNMLLSFENINGSGNFYVRYREDYEDCLLSHVISCLEKAIKGGAQVIVFPEYVVSSELSARIQKYLATNKTLIKNSKLLLVVAGSAWQKNSANVQGDINGGKLYNRMGQLLGEYQKFEPFTRTRDGKTLTEYLSNSAKISLVYISGFGLILPLICRDAVNMHGAERLIQTYNPVLTPIVAWSERIEYGFLTPMQSFAQSYYTFGVMCDACASRETDADYLGLVCAPHKHHGNGDEQFVSSTFIKKITKKPAVCTTCKVGGCIQWVTVDFSDTAFASSIEDAEKFFPTDHTAPF